MFLSLWLSSQTRIFLPLLLEDVLTCAVRVYLGLAAAAVIVGLIAIDPTLSIMICTEENAAAQAVAEHIVSMQLPDALLAKFGRLIGFHEAQKGASARTSIDVGSQNRNQVLRGKQVIIGCGGGFRHETAQKYSPILEWMAKIKLCLHDEAQQFGNLDEVAAFFLLYAAWVRSRAERPSVSYTKVVMEVAWTGHNLQNTKTN